MISLISSTGVSSSIHLPPLKISGPSDLSYLVSTTGNKLIWVYRAHESADTPSTYTVTQDGVILSKHNAVSWQDDVEIVVDIDGLNEENYIFQITVKDNGVDQGQAAPATDSVTVTVFSIPTSTSTTTTSSGTNTQSTTTSSNPDTSTTSDSTMISNSVITPIDTDTAISSETSSTNLLSDSSSSLIPSSLSSTVTSFTSENPQVPIRFLMSFLFVFVVLSRIRKLR